MTSGGVGGASGSGGAAGTGSTKRVPHLPQKVNPTGTCALQFVQARSSAAAVGAADGAGFGAGAATRAELDTAAETLPEETFGGTAARLSLEPPELDDARRDAPLELGVTAGALSAVFAQPAESDDPLPPGAFADDDEEAPGAEGELPDAELLDEDARGVSAEALAGGRETLFF